MELVLASPVHGLWVLGTVGPCHSSMSTCCLPDMGWRGLYTGPATGTGSCSHVGEHMDAFTKTSQVSRAALG